MTLYLATNNAHKADEIAGALHLLGSSLQVLPATALGGMPAVDETELTLVGNARLKARALWERTLPRVCVCADDTGLEVDALGGAPGVHTARYAGPDADHAANNAKLLRELDGLPPARRTARFVCCLLVIDATGCEHVFEGRLEGWIATDYSGGGGFGYDPVFISREHGITLAAMGAAEKNRISHRALAVRQLAEAAPRLQ